MIVEWLSQYTMELKLHVIKVKTSLVCLILISCFNQKADKFGAWTGLILAVVAKSGSHGAQNVTLHLML